ncbi:hypothetical protein Ccrd_004387 [Cynara cardunculus var. scolymus]|uniref:R13L1/DRL21-like LRR repeat region domain-containing protein n=1 Tax=Cynara cardunculus var. scolymus TaxID=59895 RepID=A0A103XMN8_CYNCS|nr:hypothetical protein Ccrd_004387 [Cynara cardunculus var. scolymus]
MISIKGLDKVQNAMHAREANLMQMRLRELEVEWSDVFDGSREEMLENEVLDVLKPDNENLEKLNIVSYGGIEFPNWVGDSLFDRLIHISIRGCKKCTSLPLLGQLPSLMELFVQGMDGVKVIELQRLAFPSLEILSFEDMQGWEVWSYNGGVVDPVCPCLQTLCIRGCPKLVEISLEELPSLRDLEIDGCSEGVLRRLVQVVSSVTKLKIVSISGLTDQLWGGVMKHLGVVEEVIIKSCNEIRYVWESYTEACKVLVNLRKLEIRRCNNLVRLGEKEEDNCGSKLTSLTMLGISSCNSMEHCNCSNSIKSLSILWCSSITSISFPTGGKKQLKSFFISDCKKLLAKDLGGGRSEETINASMCMLDIVQIKGWSNLKSVIQLSYFIHLKKLEIRNCPSMESFPDYDFPNLTSLTHLEIVKCPSMDTSFPRGLWPPNLCQLGIGGLKKPMSEWGPQNFPTSLVSLCLVSEDVTSFSELSHLLPSSLTSLHIEEFEKLESVSMGLQHLTSLQHLGFIDCPKIKHLPQTLLPSLLSLWIADCPNLEERCSRRTRGYYHNYIPT